MSLQTSSPSSRTRTWASRVGGASTSNDDSSPAVPAFVNVYLPNIGNNTFNDVLAALRHLGQVSHLKIKQLHADGKQRAWACIRDWFSSPEAQEILKTLLKEKSVIMDHPKTGKKWHIM